MEWAEPSQCEGAVDGQRAWREDDAKHQNVEERDAGGTAHDGGGRDAGCTAHEKGTSPSEPTQAEVQEHWAHGHTPVWSWCQHCVIGQGLAEYHVHDKGTRGSRADSVTRLRVHG